MYLRKNKKGNIDDPIDTIVILLVVFLVGGLMYIVLTQFGTAIGSNSSMNSSTEVITNFSNYKTSYLKSVDYAVLFIIVLFPIFSFVAAKKIKLGVNAESALASILMIFYVIASMVAANIYGQFIENANFAAVNAELTYIPVIFPNITYYLVVYFVIVLVGLYTKKDG